ncbi:MAG: uncharacterized protein JWO72_2778, partial [Caulobacteraceae bacterium]|nr:uncharacterized protein [Caulobacteraceae bacterium]
MAISLSLNNGGAAIVFQTPEGVLFERLDANLQPLGSPTSVTAAGSGWIGGQALVDGGFSVAWQTADGLMAADYDANGLLVAGPHAIGAAPPAAPLAFTSDADGATAILPAGGYVQSQQGASFSVQEFDAHGQAVGPAFVQIHGGVDALGQPLIAPLADGGYVVAYAHYYQWSESLFLARFDAQGQPAGAATAFSWSYSGGEFTNLGPYSVAGLPDGGYVVSWRQYQGASTTGQLYLREYAASGDPVGGAVLV